MIKDKSSDKIFKCEQCHKIHDGSYGSGRFCSKECAKGFSGSNRSLESRQKTGKSVSKLHLHVCPICKCQFMNKGTSLTFCTSCRNKRQKNRYKYKNQVNSLHIHKNCTSNTYCKYCGAEKGKCKRPDICKHYQLIPKLISLFHLDENTIGTENFYIEYERIKQYIYDLYWNQKLSIAQIKDLVGYKSSAGSFASFLKHFINFRSVKESINVAIQTGRMNLSSFVNTKFKSGYHITWNNKKYFYRSSYEEDFCKELDKQKIDYEVESLRIQYYDSQLNRFRFAIPDFYIPSKNLIIEVKSTFTLDTQNMYDKFLKFKQLGYNVDLLLEHQHYYDMSFFNSNTKNV